MDGIYITRAELEALEDAEGTLVKGYLWLRTRMDLCTGIVGRVTGISHSAVAEHCEYVVTKGQGSQRIRLGKTDKAAREGGRRVVERLENLGLIVKQGGSHLCFLCPKARRASVRQNQTGRYRATPVSTKRATPNKTQQPSIGAGFDESDFDLSTERATPEKEPTPPNGPHIRVQGIQPPQSSSPDCTGVDAGLDEAAGGSDRDRAPPSQACPLGRTGDDAEDLHRDRPQGASHPAPGRRLAGAAQPEVLPNAEGAGETGEGSAENESSPLPASSGPIVRIESLVEELKRRSVRVPPEPEVLQGWLTMGVTPLELGLGIERAQAQRAKDDSLQPVPVRYVAAIIQTMRSEARKAKEAGRLEVAGRKPADPNRDLEALARQVGLWPAPAGWSWARLRDEVMAKVAQEVSDE